MPRIVLRHARQRETTGIEKDNRAMLKASLDFARRHIVLFGAAKFAAGLIIGFGLGVYFLPILTAEEGLDGAALGSLQTSIERSGTFQRDLPGSDAFHWGEGTIMVSLGRIWLDGAIAPGPDYRLFLIPSFADDEASFLAIKDRAVQIAEINAFTNFSVMVPAHVDVSAFPAVLIWCEAFGEFITAAELS